MKLEGAFRKALTDTQFVDVMTTLRMEIVDMSGEEMREAIATEVENAAALYKGLAN
jgi:tripartite-type tricarboxylate transporter receptor subunit TctC